MPYFALKKVEKRVRVDHSDKIFAELEGEWKNTLVAQFVGRISNFGVFHRMINKLWGKGKEVDMRSAGEKLFIIRFPS